MDLLARTSHARGKSRKEMEEPAAVIGAGGEKKKKFKRGDELKSKRIKVKEEGKSEGVATADATSSSKETKSAPSAPIAAPIEQVGKEGQAAREGGQNTPNNKATTKRGKRSFEAMKARRRKTKMNKQLTKAAFSPQPALASSSPAPAPSLPLGAGAASGSASGFATGFSSGFTSGLLVIPCPASGAKTKRSKAAPLLCRLLQTYLNEAQKKGGLGLKKEGGFRELVQKDVGRYDLNLDHLVQNNKESNRALFNEEKEIMAVREEIDAVLKPHLQSIFGGLYIPNAFGAVISKPGTDAQRWHVDSSHLFQARNPSEEALYAKMPCHFVTVFCPLFPYSEAIGPTEIAVNSARLTSVLQNSEVEDQYPAEDVVNRILADGKVKKTKLQCSVGDIAIMDGRTLHRGGSNGSDEDRPLLYMSYCLPWYHEFPRSQNDNRSLFD